MNCVAMTPPNAARIAVDAVPIDVFERSRAIAIELDFDLRRIIRCPWS